MDNKEEKTVKIKTLVDLLPEDTRPIAGELGVLVMMFSALEFQTSLLLGQMLRLGLGDEAHAVLGHIALKERLQILRKYGFAVKHSEDWYVRLQKCLNHIENTLSPERNRMVHDLWGRNETGEMLRIKTTPTIKQPNTKAERHLKGESLPITAEGISKWTWEVLATTAEVIHISDEMRLYREKQGASPNKSG